MLDAAVDGTFKGIYIQGEDILQSDPNTKHVAAGLAAMECVVVHDLFLNETANYAHVFLPGSTFLEKDGTFTNAERRINRVRKVMAPKNGLADWEVTQKLAQAMGLPGTTSIRPRSWTRSPRRRRPSPASPTTISTRWARCSGPATRRRRKARRSCISAASCAARASSSVTEYVATDEKTGPRFPLLLTTGRILSQYNVGAQTRRTEQCRLAQGGRAEQVLLCQTTFSVRRVCAPTLYCAEDAAGGQQQREARSGASRRSARTR